MAEKVPLTSAGKQIGWAYVHEDGTVDMDVF